MAAGRLIAVVTGLRAEAVIAARLGPARAGGGGAAGAAEAARALIDAGAAGLLSFGLAGGLDPALPAGALLVPDCVLCRGEAIATDPAIRERLGAGVAAPLLAGDAVVVSAEAKRRLWRETGAASVDLESGAVAAVAAARGLPFALLRVVCDPATRSLPPAALAALDARGAVALSLVLRSVARRPGQIGALLALARDAARARKNLVGRVDEIVAQGGLFVA